MRGSRLRRSGAGLTAGLAVLLPALVTTGSAHADPSTLTSSQATQLARDPDTPVIVLLKNQHPDLPARQQRAARTKALRSDQSPVVDELHQVHAGRVHQYATLNAVSATVSKAEAGHLATKPGVAAVAAAGAAQEAQATATAMTRRTGGSSNPPNAATPTPTSTASASSWPTTSTTSAIAAWDSTCASCSPRCCGRCARSRRRWPRWRRAGASAS